MISGALLLSVVVQLVIVGLIFWLVLWFLGWVGLPDPFMRVAKVVIGLVAIVWLINVLLSLGGHPLVRYP